MAKVGRARFIEVIGEEELAKRMRMVSDATKGKELRRAVRAGLTVVRREAIRLAPVRSDGRMKKVSKGSAETRAPGNLKKNIGTSTRQVSPTRVSGSVGLRKFAWYGRLVELGHLLVKVSGSRKGKRTWKNRSVANKVVIGHVPAKPFLRPALEGSHREVVARVQERFNQNIQKVTRGNR